MSKLHILPCLDLEEQVAARKKRLDFPVDVAASLGWSAWDAIQKGYYVTKSGQRVDWKEAVQVACEGKISIPPEAPLPLREKSTFPETRVQVTNETTLEAAKRLTDLGLRPLALNFANGVQPGGGFLSGALAQEEGLCRSSALYATLEGDPMYAAHRKRPCLDSTDWAILSPNVPVFRTDEGIELPEPWLLSFLTCAAPYAPKIGQPESGDLLQKRIHRVLSIAQAYGYVALVLGAWGCGAFGNDPYRTAKDFRQALETGFCGAYLEVVFAIADHSPERRTLAPFRGVFA